MAFVWNKILREWYIGYIVRNNGINGKGNGGSGGYVPSEHSRSDRCPVSLRDDNLDGDGNHDHTNGGNNGNKGNGGNGGNDGNGI